MFFLTVFSISHDLSHCTDNALLQKKTLNLNKIGHPYDYRCPNLLIQTCNSGNMFFHGLTKTLRLKDFSLCSKTKHPGKEDGAVGDFRCDFNAAAFIRHMDIFAEPVYDSIDQALVKGKGGLYRCTVIHTKYPPDMFFYMKHFCIQRFRILITNFHMSHSVNPVVDKCIMLFAVGD